MQRGSRKNRVLDFWVGIPLLNALATLRRKRKFSRENVRRIGVMCSPALGDTLLFSAALQDLRTAFPAPAEIIHFCMRSNLAAAELLPWADKRVVLELTHPPSAIRALRAERLDWMLDFSSWQRLTAFYTMASGAGFTAGFRTPTQYRSRGYDLTVEHRDDCHEVENFRSLVRALGLPAGCEPAIESPGEGPSAASGDTVVFHLWASGQRSRLREWPEERWLALARLIARPDTTFYLTGAPSDLPRIEVFLVQLRGAGLRAEPAIGRDGFRSLIALLRQARVVVSVNTGVMHLAALVGAPTVAINGPNRNGRWGPVGLRALGIEAPGEGCGYLHLGFNFDGQPTDCMERITVEMVEAAIGAVTKPGARTQYGVLTAPAVRA